MYIRVSALRLKTTLQSLGFFTALQKLSIPVKETIYKRFKLYILTNIAICIFDFFDTIETSITLTRAL